MKQPSGLEILEDREGSGPVATIGDTVIYNVRIFLNRGDEVPMNEAQLKQGISPDRMRQEENRMVIDHVAKLGKRQVMAGIEKALVGMRPGGFRKVRVSPHLAYGSHGIPGLIPPGALEVDDFDAAINRLRASDCAFRLEPLETPVCHMTVVSDPDGNSVTIHQRKAG